MCELHFTCLTYDCPFLHDRKEYHLQFNFRLCAGWNGDEGCGVGGIWQIWLSTKRGRGCARACLIAHKFIRDPSAKVSNYSLQFGLYVKMTSTGL